MSKYKVYHLVPNPGPKPGWRVEGENSVRPSSWHATKDQAIERGRQLARRARANSSFTKWTVPSRPNTPMAMAREIYPADTFAGSQEAKTKGALCRSFCFCY